VSNINPAMKTSTTSTNTTMVPVERRKRSHLEETRRDRLRPPTLRVRRDTSVIYPQVRRIDARLLDENASLKGLSDAVSDAVMDGSIARLGLATSRAYRNARRVT
jgi:hypothetical protein